MDIIRGDDMKYRYILFDIYDLEYGEPITKDEIIGRANTRQEVRKIWNEQSKDTDGECYIIIFDRETKKEVQLYEI